MQLQTDPIGKLRRLFAGIAPQSAQPADPASFSDTVYTDAARCPPWRIAAELAVFFAIVGIIAHFYFPPGALSGLRPHPFGLAVVVASLQYGTVPGLCATFLSLAIQWLLGWPQPAIGEEHFSYLARTWSEPAMWLALALLVGDMRDRQIDDNAKLASDLHASHSDRELLGGRCEALDAKVHRLERALVAQSPGGQSPGEMQNLLAAIARLGEPRRTDDSDIERSRSLGQCGRLLLGATRISLWRLDRGRLEVEMTAGWPTPQEWRRSFAAGDPLFEAIAIGQQGLNALRPDDRPQLQAQGLMAAPIICIHTGNPLGMIKVEDIEVERRLADQQPALRTLCQAIAVQTAARSSSRNDPPNHSTAAGPEQT